MIDLDTMRHSTAHVMAKAVQRLFPGTRLGIGPTIENGFYYDLDVPQPLSPEDLPKIEEEMRRIVQADEPFVRKEVSREDALALFQQKGEPFKVEIIQELPDDKVSLYETGDWVDLCRGPHVPSTGHIAAFKLLNVAGAYWRGDERRPMLQRIYGTAWPSQDQLDRYLWALEEAKKRDHKKLGRELGIFLISEEVGAGLPLWLPKGATIRRVLEEFILEQERQDGYLHVYTPHIAKLDLYKRSGHWPYYQSSMYPPIRIEDEEFMLRPMNCPHHVAIYKSETRSYRDLPMRIGELGTVFRYEKSGELSGLIRVRTFTINDAHIFCQPDQVRDEVVKVLELTRRVYRALHVDQFWMRLSLRDEHKDKFIGGDATWEQAENALRHALESIGEPYVEARGEAAFYGPKIDIQVRDALGREYTASTVQLDFSFPEKFNLEYVAPDGSVQRPVMIHRAPIGSLERMVAFLIEHYAGAFPLWLAPVQVVVIPIADRHGEYGEQIARRLKSAGFRVEVDARRERVNYKIREAQVQKVPYMLVLGDKEVQTGTVAVRERTQGNLGTMSIDEMLATLQQRREAYQ